MYRFQAAIAPLESIVILDSLVKPVNLTRIGKSGRVLIE